jgi:diacylglycerol kinase family enzyme
MTEPGRLPAALVITNESAGGTRAEAVTAALAVLRTGFDVDVETCREPAEMARILSRCPHDTVIVAGGDGSLHTLVGALWRRGEAGARVVGLLPLGTGNDFARGQRIPLEPERAAAALLQAEPAAMDLLVDDQETVVVNAVHAGVGATAARVAGPAKPWLGRFAFTLGAIWAGLTSPGWRWRVDVDGVTVSRPGRRILMVVVANGPYIAGAGAIVGPAARVDDAQADVTVAHAVGPWERLRYGLRLRRGTHPRDETVSYLRGRQVTIVGEQIWVNADGEVYGPAERRTWTLQPGAWRFLRPVPPSDSPR